MITFETKYWKLKYLKGCIDQIYFQQISYYAGDTTYLLWIGNGEHKFSTLKKQQKQAISRSWWLFLCAKATRLLLKKYGSKCLMLPYIFKRHCYVLKLPCSRAEAAKFL